MNPPIWAGVASMNPWRPPSSPVITCRTIHATSSHNALSDRFRLGELTIFFCCPKLRANAPITALIAPLAPIIGVGDSGATSHCAIAAVLYTSDAADERSSVDL